MESKKLEALMMSVDLGSFTRAAEVLGYTQSGLTHMMNSLEKEIGVPLLERGRGGVRLTPEGERVAPAIRDFLDSASRLDAALTQAGDVRREAIRVGTYASMGVHRASSAASGRNVPRPAWRCGSPTTSPRHTPPSFRGNWT